MNHTTYTYEITPQIVDFSHKLTLNGLVEILIDVAGKSADKNGFGMRHIEPHGHTWVLSRLAVEMSNYLPIYQTIKIATWVEKVKHAHTERNFLIYDTEGNTIGQAKSIWVMIDVSTRRPVDLYTLQGIQKAILTDSLPMQPPKKISPCTNEPLQTISVRYSHIDLNQHTTTSRYIEWLLNNVPLHMHQTKKISRFDINFIAETRYGDDLQLHKEECTERHFRFDLKKSNHTACRAEMIFV